MTEKRFSENIIEEIIKKIQKDVIADKLSWDDDAIYYGILEGHVLGRKEAIAEVEKIIEKNAISGDWSWSDLKRDFKNLKIRAEDVGFG